MQPVQTYIRFGVRRRGPDTLDVRVPAPLGAPVGVRHGHAPAGPLPHTSHTAAMTGFFLDETQTSSEMLPARLSAIRLTARLAPSLCGVPTLERFEPRSAARHGRHVPRHDEGPRRRHQPAQRLPGARRRHRHEHGAHARRGGRRARPAPTPSCDATCDAISHGSLMGARGNSGVILSQILRGLVGTLKRARPTSTGDHGRRGARRPRRRPPTRRC